MKKIICEMCGSNDLLKKDNVFICQSCGTKYSVEEAKKMMIEGKVDVSGSTVKVDENDKISNYFMMATNAYDADNKSEAENYCNKIIEIDPENSEAWFLKGKSAGWQSSLANIRFEETVNAFQKAINYSSEKEKKKVTKEAVDEITNLCNALVTTACNNYAESDTVGSASTILSAVSTMIKTMLSFLAKCKEKTNDINAEIADKINCACVSAYTEIYSDYEGSDGHPSEYDFENYASKLKSLISLEEFAISLSDNDVDNAKTIYKNLIYYTDALEKACSYKYQVNNGYGSYVVDKCWTVEYKNSLVDKIMEYHEKIHDLDPNYVIPPRPNVSKQGGCYVATCVYGSYDCPEVWTLRRFRDYTLAEKWYGRLFIHVYYAVSPTIVKLFGDTKWFKKIWKGKLDKLVNKLQIDGVENTPYNDRDWK